MAMTARLELGASVVGFVPGGDIAKAAVKGATKATKVAAKAGAKAADNVGKVVKGSTAAAADGLSGAQKGAGKVNAPRGPPSSGDANATTDARFIGQPDGKLVDTHATPRGSYEQPHGGRTDILQAEDHGAGLSHTHDPIVNTNPKTGKTFVNGRRQPGRPVSVDDVRNIRSGAAVPSLPKGR